MIPRAVRASASVGFELDRAGARAVRRAEVRLVRRVVHLDERDRLGLARVRERESGVRRCGAGEHLAGEPQARLPGLPEEAPPSRRVLLRPHVHRAALAPGPRRPQDRHRTSAGGHAREPHRRRRERAEHGLAVARPRHRVLVEHARHERSEVRCAGDVDRRCRVRVRRGAARVGGERQLAREHPEQDGAEGEDIRPLVLRRAAPLLRRHVRGRPAADAAVPERVREPEVEHLHGAALAQEHVAGLEVAVRDAVRVRVRDGGRDLDADGERVARAHRPRGEAVRERLAAEQLEDEVGAVLRSADVAERDDVRVREPRRDLGLPQELLLARRRGGAGAHRLERDRSAAPEVARLPDDAEAAAADLPQERVAAHRGAGAEPAVPCAAQLRGRGPREVGEQRRKLARCDAAPRLRHGASRSEGGEGSARGPRCHRSVRSRRTPTIRAAGAGSGDEEARAGRASSLCVDCAPASVRALSRQRGRAILHSGLALRRLCYRGLLLQFDLLQGSL